MKLCSVRITNFKSIDDSERVKFENVTCLVGKNESGKTAFLQALQKLNPAPGVSGDFDDLMEYPKKGYSQYKRTKLEAPARVVEAEFELRDAEMAQIEGKFGRGVLPSRHIRVIKNYENLYQWEFQVDEAAVVSLLLASAELPENVQARAEDSSTIEGLEHLLQELSGESSEVDNLLNRLHQEFHRTVYEQISDDYLKHFLPRFVYFDDYSIMAGRNSISHLINLRASGADIKPSDRTFLCLLDFLGVSLEQLQSEQNFERLKAELEAAASSITQEVFAFWSQNRQLRVEFSLANANPNDPAPLNSGPIFHIRIWNDRHQVTVTFDERSRGFIWFFSFLAYFSQLEGGDHDLVLLLDEPGLNLHAKAQSDFLRFIDQRLAPKHQVIYTTHSPFMIEPSQLQRVRTVEDLDGHGTVVSENILRNDRDTVFPLQAALGYELAQTLFVGLHNLLVEGSSDIVYLQFLSEVCFSHGRCYLDPRWTLVPVGGADKVSTFVSLFGGNQLDIAVLLDVSKKDKQRIENLMENELLKRNNLIQVGEITGTPDADIEDLFDPAFYLELVNAAYAEQLAKEVTLEDLQEGMPRIVQRIEAYFKQEDINNGRFSHLRPASYLLTHQAEYVDRIDEATLDRMTALFDKLNALLPSATQ